MVQPMDPLKAARQAATGRPVRPADEKLAANTLFRRCGCSSPLRAAGGTPICGFGANDDPSHAWGSAPQVSRGRIKIVALCSGLGTGDGAQLACCVWARASSKPQPPLLHF